ncbi:MAG TPA: energy transducer TonB, partial [Candidatus Angelobacter sp.]|nr:energy transducer TonB [Candidatus Angelobacter sp.]
SDSGYYVLAQIEPSKTFTGPNRGTVLISAQDLFFGYTPAKNALELVNVKRGRLNPEYKVERQPTEVTIAGRPFYRMDYMSPIAELHWYTLTTQIRCHSVEFMLTSRDPELLESLAQGIDKAKLSEENAPVCVKNYASGDNVLLKVDPVLTDRKFNPIPVRIIIDRYGKVKHVHVISAFPEQARTITDALLQWEFKPYKKNGEPVEIETGIMFGNARMPGKTTTSMKD